MKSKLWAIKSEGTVDPKTLYTAAAGFYILKSIYVGVFCFAVGFMTRDVLSTITASVKAKIKNLN